MKRKFAIPVLTALALAGATRIAVAEGTPTVVELFTSQGCSSCPPADAFLTELAARDDIIAISFHVNYWDYIGWKDPFATEWSTQRQYAYAKVLGRGYPYTPQMVVDGKHDLVGSHRAKVANALVSSMAEADSRVVLSLKRNGDELVVTLPPATVTERLDLWMVRYSGPHETKVARGENRGATLVNTHIALAMGSLGRWDGQAGEIHAELPLPENREGGIAVWLQEPSAGAILGAAKLDLGGGR